MTESILAAYQASLAAGDYDRPTDLEYDFESVNQRLWDEKEAQGRGTREEFEAEKAEKERAIKEEEEKKKSGGKKGKSGR